LAACCRLGFSWKLAERWNRLYQRADMNEAEQEDRIKAWLVQEGKGRQHA
jgi:hypothetical protein